MQLVTDISQLPEGFRAGAITIGNFDGVHRGHAELLRRLTARAAEFSGPAAVFTFDPHPVQLLRPDQAPIPLTQTARKAELLGKLGIDIVIAYPTTQDFLSLTPEAYFRQVILEQLKASAIVEGPNFFFGRGRAGDTTTLQQLCSQHQVTCEIVEPLRDGEEFVSSSRIRKAIAAGNVQLANQMLLEPYQIRGEVTHGAGRGRHIGFPTANLSGIQTLLPASGVYSGLVSLDGDTKQAAINIGPNPTFGDDQLKVEVYVLDYSGSLYGEVLDVAFVQKLRDVQSFSSVSDLKQQLEQDIAQVQETAIRRQASDGETSSAS